MNKKQYNRCITLSIYALISIALIGFNLYKFYEQRRLEPELEFAIEEYDSRLELRDSAVRARSELSRIEFSRQRYPNAIENFFADRDFESVDVASLLSETVTTAVVPISKLGDHDFKIITNETDPYEFVLSLSHKIKPQNIRFTPKSSKLVKKYEYSFPVEPNVVNSFGIVLDGSRQLMIVSRAKGIPDIIDILNLRDGGRSSGGPKIFAGKPIPNEDGIWFEAKPYKTIFLLNSDKTMTEFVDIDLTFRKRETSGQ